MVGIVNTVVDIAISGVKIVKYGEKIDMNLG